MEDFDLLYLLKTPFLLGNSHKALSEAEELEIDESDTRNNELKSFYLIRILADLGDVPKMKAVMKDNFSKHEEMIKAVGALVQYAFTENIDKDFLYGEIASAIHKPGAYPETKLTVLVYLTYLIKDYDKLFELTNHTKNLELLSVKFCGFIEIFRFDLAKQTLEEMQNIDDDHCLTNLWFAILGFSEKETIEKYREKVVELGEKNEYTIKVYTLLALTLMRESKFDNAIKIFEKALESLNLISDHTQYEKYVVKGNEDLAAFWVNYLKCNAILGNESSETIAQITKILKIVSPNNPYWKEEETAFKMFDEAIE